MSNSRTDSEQVFAVVRNRIPRGEEHVIFATAGQVKDARAWAADCLWEDATGDEIFEMPAAVVVRSVDRHYDGGWTQFVADGSVTV